MEYNYTELGHRLTELVGSQVRIAEVMGIAQACVSRKLHGDVSITLANLEKVAAFLKRPMTIFFEKRGTDGAVLNAFHDMHMHAPEAVDQLINAFRHHRRTLRMLGKDAEKLMQEVAPELRRQDRIRLAGVAGMEEETDAGKDDNQADHGVGPDEA